MSIEAWLPRIGTNRRDPGWSMRPLRRKSDDALIVRHDHDRHPSHDRGGMAHRIGQADRLARAHGPRRGPGRGTGPRRAGPRPGALARNGRAGPPGPLVDDPPQTPHEPPPATPTT